MLTLPCACTSASLPIVIVASALILARLREKFLLFSKLSKSLLIVVSVTKLKKAVGLPAAYEFVVLASKVTDGS